MKIAFLAALAPWREYSGLGENFENCLGGQSIDPEGCARQSVRIRTFCRYLDATLARLSQRAEGNLDGERGGCESISNFGDVPVCPSSWQHAEPWTPAFAGVTTGSLRRRAPFTGSFRRTPESRRLSGASSPAGRIAPHREDAPALTLGRDRSRASSCGRRGWCA